MKKLLLLTMFSIGVFMVSQAQDLDYTIVNDLDAKWNFGMNHTGGGGGEIVLIPTESTVTGLIEDVDLPLSLAIKDVAGTDCLGFTSVTAVGSGSISVSCNNSTPPTVTYTLTYDLANQIYYLDVLIE